MAKRNPQIIRLSNDVSLRIDSAASKYGVPVCRITGVPDDLAPGNVIPRWEDVLRATGDDSLPMSVRSFCGRKSGELVASLSRTVGDEGIPDQHKLSKLTELDIKAIQEFLAQDPTGASISVVDGHIVATTSEGHSY